ncbi:unnamed protein product, partial [Mesorhabditis spiculigera]
MLNLQYRMHAALAAFPSSAFYGGKLLNGVTEGAHPSSLRLKAHPSAPAYWTWPAGPQMPCVHPEVKGENGSAANPGEAELVTGLVKMLLLQHRASDFGIITAYDAQRRLLRKNLGLERAFDGVEVQNVDAFQAREKDFILISAVRSNAQHQLGFLNDARRLNVAITRAKRGLIIFGAGHLLSTDPVWAKLLMYYEVAISGAFVPRGAELGEELRDRRRPATFALSRQQHAKPTPDPGQLHQLILPWFLHGSDDNSR